MATTPRIAIVDSPTVLRDGLVAALGQLGYHVALVCDHGEHYIRASKECPVDLVLLNVGPYPSDREPAMHGLATLGCLRDHARKVPVLALSDRPDDDLAYSAFRAGARGFERRELDKGTLHRAVASLLRGDLYTNAYLEVYHNSPRRPLLQPGPGALQLLLALSTPTRALFDAIVREPRSKNARLAVIRDLSVNTIKTHMRHLFAALGVKDRAELLLFALSLGLLRTADTDTGNSRAGGKAPEPARRRASHPPQGPSTRTYRPATRT